MAPCQAHCQLCTTLKCLVPSVKVCESDYISKSEHPRILPQDATRLQSKAELIDDLKPKTTEYGKSVLRKSAKCGKFRERNNRHPSDSSIKLKQKFILVMALGALVLGLIPGSG